MPNIYIPPCKLTAKQLRDSLLQAIRDDKPDTTGEGIVALLMLHYPDEFQRLARSGMAER